MVGYSASSFFDSAGHTVILNLKARDDESVDNMLVNRVGLKCESISITTTRTIPSYPIPMSGAVTGESLTVAMDLGMAQKTINISGIITEQTIYKKFGTSKVKQPIGDSTIGPTIGSDGVLAVRMTAFEVTQLIHSYVDSSVFQEHQTFNEIIIAIPSRVGKDYQYHASLVNENDAINADMTTLPLIPFGYGVRDDGKGTKKLDNIHSISIPGRTSSFPDIISTDSNPVGMGGFIRNFNSTFVGGQPFVEFTLDFEVAQIGMI